MRFLVFTTDVLPIAGLPTSGTALRTHGLVEGLRSHGHEVVVSVPSFALQSAIKGGALKALEEQSKDPSALKKFESLKKLAFDSGNQSRIVEEIQPDCIICGHWPAMMLPLKPSQALVIDLAGPHLLERHYQGSGEHVGAALAKLSVIATADYYIVSGPTQQRYFLSYILRADVSRPQERIITIPMPLNPELPQHGTFAAESYPRFVFGGVFLPWQDPSRSLTTVAALLREKERGELKLIGGKHPHYKVNTGNYSPLFAELATNPRVVTKPLLPFDEFAREISDADVALDLMAWNLERELAVTIRSTTYLWAGLPVIYNDYADLGLLIRQYDAGWCIAPDDDAALKQVIEEILADPAAVREKSTNAQALAKREFSWDRAVSPLLYKLLGRVADLSQNLDETDILFDLPEQQHLSASAREPMRQLFVCRKNGLSRVECRIAQESQTPGTTVKLRLFKGSSADTLLAESSFDANSLLSRDWLTLDLSPIGDSAGKTFMVEILPQGRSSDKEAGEATVRPCLIGASPYPLVGTFHGEHKLDRTAICLRTAVSPDAMGTPRTLGGAPERGE